MTGVATRQTGRGHPSCRLDHLQRKSYRGERASLPVPASPHAPVSPTVPDSPTAAASFSPWQFLNDSSFFLYFAVSAAFSTAHSLASASALLPLYPDAMHWYSGAASLGQTTEPAAAVQGSQDPDCDLDIYHFDLYHFDLCRVGAGLVDSRLS